MTYWSARVEFADRGISDEQWDALATELQPVHGVAGAEREPGRASAHISVEASTLRQAIDEALRAVGEAVRAVGLTFVAVGVEVVDEQTASVRLERPSIPDLVGFAEIASMPEPAITRQRARMLPKTAPGFPGPAVVTAQGPLFVREQVEAFFARWSRQGGWPRKEA